MEECRLDNRGRARRGALAFPPPGWWSLPLGLLMAAAWPAPASGPEALLQQLAAEAGRQAGQPVRLRVDRLNRADGWALVSGAVESADGRPLDWSLARDPACQAPLDKGLWAVARREGAGWQLEELLLCASEPPYWYLEDDAARAFARPCSLYRGLQVDAQRTAEDQCRAWQGAGR